MSYFDKVARFSCSVLLITCISQPLVKGQEVSGQTNLSYIFLDQTGDRNAAPELYNVYSGFSFERLNLNGKFKGNSTFQFDLKNANLDNRDLSLGLSMPDLFSLNMAHQRSRFVFDKDGDFTSLRTRTAVGLTFKPVRLLQVNCDYSHQLKESTRLSLVEADAGILGEKYDQKIQDGGAGIQLKLGKSYLTLSHRILLFDNERQDSTDRQINRTEVSLNTSLSSNTWGSLKYMREESLLEERNPKLKTDLLAVTIFQRVSSKVLVGGKISLQRSDNLSTIEFTDVGRVGFSLNYRISRMFKVNLGCDYYNKKDPAGEIDTYSFLAGAKVNPARNLSVQGLYRFKIRKEDPDTSTLIGEYDQDNRLLKVKYRPIDNIRLQAKYRDRVRDNEGIGTRTEMRGIYSDVLFDLGEDISVTLNFNLLDSDFRNTETDFTTSNRTYGLAARLRVVRSLRVVGGANYLDLGRDVDIEKLSLNVAVSYEFLEDFGLELAFQRFTYDMTSTESHMDANVFRLGVSRAFKKY